MSSLEPTLSSVVGPRPATSIEDVQAKLTSEVVHAVFTTTARIEGLTREIDGKTKDRAMLEEHLRTLHAWLNANGTPYIEAD